MLPFPLVASHHQDVDALGLADPEQNVQLALLLGREGGHNPIHPHDSRKFDPIEAIGFIGMDKKKQSMNDVNVNLPVPWGLVTCSEKWPGPSKSLQ